MLCLGIESSCDETAVALVDDGRPVDSIMASQAPVHALFGGVVPELASREHYRFIGPLFDKLLDRNHLVAADIDLVAVARGPGLLGSLLVGLSFAKALALGLNRPLLGINHLHAHLLAVGLENSPEYPALGILVSGGHTHLYRIESPWRFIQLGRSLDDAAGEAFDKIGNALGLDYPAGRLIDEYAARGHADPHLFPRPYLANSNLDFSFSGLKTAASEYLRQHGLWHAGPPADPNSPQAGRINDFCASFNLAIAETLAAKTERALEDQQDVKSVWLAGGVAANSMIRGLFSDLSQRYAKSFLVPTPALCTDNAAMIAHAGCLLGQAGYSHPISVPAIPRGTPIPDDMRRSA